MTTTEDIRTAAMPADTARTVIVTSDSHVAPLLSEQLRDYCPDKYLDDFDRFVSFAANPSGGSKPGKTVVGHGGMTREVVEPDPQEDPRLSVTRNALTTGGWDPHQRIRDMDRDGVAGEVIFHGLNTGRQDLMPFNGPFGAFGLSGYDNELVGAGRHMYNRWLSDFVSVEPARHAGLAHMPMWDPEACVKEVEWAAEAGLRGINFPRPQAAIPSYNDPVWDPFWSACEALNMPLTTHAQAPGPPPSTTPQQGDFEVYMLDIMGDNGRKAMYQLVFGGVFERHPGLRLVYTEVLDLWWVATMARMDGMATFFWYKEASLPPSQRVLLGTKLPKMPSEYCMQNVFIGWTGMAPFEVQDAVEHGYTSQVLWGSDYPHPEGSWQYPRTEDEVPMTHLHLRDSFARAPRDHAAAMIGANAIRVYGLDAVELTNVARRINSLTFGELAEPFDDEPEDIATRSAKLCFRRNGPWY